VTGVPDEWPSSTESGLQAGSPLISCGLVLAASVHDKRLKTSPRYSENIAGTCGRRCRTGPGVLAERLHAEEQAGEIWTDLLASGRLLDPDAQQLFERFALTLGETGLHVP
jgi:hypothetical protein